MLITRRWLTRRRACPEQVAIVEAEWADGAELTAANIRRAVELRLDLDWLAPRVLTALALRAYDEATALALIEALGLAEWETSEHQNREGHNE